MKKRKRSTLECQEAERLQPFYGSQVYLITEALTSWRSLLSSNI